MRTNIVLAALVFAAAIIGCSKLSELPTAVAEQQVVGGRVLHQGAPAVSTKVLVVVESGRDVEAVTNESGSFSCALSSGERVVGIVAVAPLKSGMVTVNGSQQFYEIVLDAVPTPSMRAAPPAGIATHELWYGMYDEKDGNLRFRYQYTFNRFVCINWMPWVFPYTISPDPNKWTSWDLTDFPSPWKGKKLLVPTRYRWWHGAVYGYSISQALYLIATK